MMGRLAQLTRALRGGGAPPSRGDRPPLVLVPGFLGTRLRDGRGRSIWGALQNLYWGPSIADAEGVEPAGLLTEFRVLPGLYHVDVHAGLLAYLARVGGYRLDEDLFVLGYDWRLGIAHAAGALAALVARIRGASDAPVDVVGISTGGLVARAFLAARERGAAAPPVRRMVYVAAPQRGSFDALATLVEGYRVVPGGKRFAGREGGQTPFDALPHPDERLFVDASGASLALDHFDGAVWRRLGLDPGLPDLDARLAAARELRATLDAAELDLLKDATGVPPAVVVIGGKHKPTRARILVAGGRARIPPVEPAAGDPLRYFLYRAGDGELDLDSLTALPGLAPERVRFVTPEAHCRLPSDAQVHRFIVEALG